MADPTASVLHPESPGPAVRLSHPILTAVQTYAGQFAAAATAAAAAGDGFLVQYAALQGQALLGGQFSDQTLGDGTAENNWDGSGRVLKRMAVTGATTTAADFGKTVWAADSGPPLVLTDPGTTIPFGIILDVTATGEADVWQFGLEALALMGIIQQSVIAAGALTAWGTRIGNV